MVTPAFDAQSLATSLGNGCRRSVTRPRKGEHDMTSMPRHALVAAIFCTGLLTGSATVHAQAQTTISSTRCGDGLKSFGPLSQFGYPSYYVDQDMFALDHCDEPLSVDPLCGNPDFGQPEGLPFDAPPDVASGNFWAETFYTRGDAIINF